MTPYLISSKMYQLPAVTSPGSLNVATDYRGHGFIRSPPRMRCNLELFGFLDGGLGERVSPWYAVHESD